MPAHKPLSRWKKFAAGVAAVAVTGAGIFTVRNLPYFVGETVTQVFDGDSFKIANKQTIRLASLDAPETGNCYAAKATAALTAKILGKKVVLRYPQTDRYGRVMALVYVNGELVNEYLVRHGFAVTTREAWDENSTISDANTYARTHKLGIFSSLCTQIDPPDPKCPIKGNIDDRNHIKEYLTPACPDYSKTIIEQHMGEKWFCTESEAKQASFIKSSSCFR